MEWNFNVELTLIQAALALGIAIIASTLGGVLGGRLLSGKQIDPTLAAIMGGFFGLLVGTSAMMIGLILIFILNM